MADLTIPIKVPPVDYPVPEALESFSMNPLSGTSMELGWSDPNAGSLEYQVQAALSGAFNSPIVDTAPATPGTTGTHTMNGLSSGTTYHFRMRVKYPGPTYSDWVSGIDTMP